MRLVALVSLSLFTTVAIAQNPPASDPLAITLAQQSVTALTGGTPLFDVTLNTNVLSIYGSDSESGTGVFNAKGTSESRIDLNLNGGTRSDVRYLVSGYPAGAWSKNGAASTPYSGHNCWTDATWFFPALSALTQTANPNFIFKYIGQEQHAGLSTQHIRIFRIGQQDPTDLIQRLSATDFYLDANSTLPLALAARTHGDGDEGIDLAIEARFANYQPVSGLMVPFHFQQMLNGGVVLDVSVTSAAFNTGLLDSLFNLP